MIDKYWKRCETCANFDKEKSNQNWIVCSDMPLEAVINRSSDNCQNYKPAENEPKQ